MDSGSIVEESICGFEMVASVGDCVEGGFRVVVDGGRDMAGSLDRDCHGKGKEFWGVRGETANFLDVSNA